MKKLIATTVAVGLLTTSLLAQGTVNFANNVTGVLQAKIFGPQAGNPTNSVTGNTATETPAGSAVYTGALLNGPTFLVQLFSASGANQTQSSLAPQAISSFRTGSAAGIWTSLTAALSNVAPDASVATLQVRVWDNTSGLYSSWATAETAWLAGTIAAAQSALLNVNSIGGNVNTPPNLTGLTSFNIYTIATAPVPEPGTMALAALGGASLLLFRRKK